MGNLITSNRHPHRKFPRKIYAEILSRVPAVDLVNYMTVCKKWYALIKDPNFVKLHSSRASTSSTILLASYDPQQFTPSTVFSMNSQNHILSSTEGLVCVRTISASVYCISNPLTCKLLVLPSLPKGVERAIAMKLYNVDCAQKLKVVAVSNIKGDDGPPACWYILNILAGRRSKWRTAKLPHPCIKGDREVKFQRHYLYDDGVHYYRSSTETDSDLDTIQYEFYSLDLENEVAIKHTELPWRNSLRDECRMIFTNWEGHFAVVLFWRKGCATSKMEVWMLEDHKKSKWRRKFVASPFKWDDEGKEVQICFTRDEKMWCTKRHTNAAFSIHLRTRERQDYDLNVHKILLAFPHKSTLERLEGMD